MNIANENLYFAYGSNLLEREVRKQAAGAVSRGVAFLPGYRSSSRSTQRRGAGMRQACKKKAAGKSGDTFIR